MGKKRFVTYYCDRVLLTSNRSQKFQCNEYGLLRMSLQVNCNSRTMTVINEDEVILHGFLQLFFWVDNGDFRMTMTERIKSTSPSKNLYNFDITNNIPYGYVTCTIIALEDAPRTEISTNVASFANRFSDRYLSETFSDVSIQVDGEKLPAHLLILTSSSPVFAAMFTHDTLEKQNSLITIKDFDLDIVKEMLYYMYMGDLHDDLEWQVVSKLHRVADKYSILGLKQLCEERIMSLTTVDNVADVFLFANSNSEDLKELCFAFICFHQCDLTTRVSFQSSIRNHPSIAAEIFKFRGMGI